MNVMNIEGGAFCAVCVGVVVTIRDGKCMIGTVSAGAMFTDDVLNDLICVRLLKRMSCC